MYWYCGYCWYSGTSYSIFLYQYVTNTALVLLFICTGTLATVGTLVPATPHWCQPLYVNVSISYWYHTGIALYMYWYCGYCWYIGTRNSNSLYQCVTDTALVLLYICTGTVDTIGTLVPATLFLHTNMLLVLVFICGYFICVHCGYCWYIGISHSMSLYQYVTSTSLVLMFICTGTVATVGTLVPVTLCLFAYILLVPHWYCSLYVLVL